MKVAVIAAHPDDEILGCGAAIAQHVLAGDEVRVLIMAEGITARDTSRNLDKHITEIQELRKVAEAANKSLGVSNLTLKEFPDNRMDSVALIEVVKEVENFIFDYRPSLVYSHHGGDLNIDHQVVHKAVLTACRPVPQQCVETLLFFEVNSSTEWQSPSSGTAFQPNWFVDASKTLEKKIKALQTYHCEMKDWPHSRSIEAVTALARWRGASMGWEAAEAFVLGRHRVSKFYSAI